MAIHQFDEREALRLEKQYAIPVMVEQRRCTLDALNLQPGERVLDVGSGPGYLTQQIAALTGPQGRVCAIDTSESMLEAGKQRCASYANVEFQHADACKLPFPDASFDAAVAVQVYLFVPELDLALPELLRVLRPGGRAVVVDTDWGSAVWNSHEPARMSRFLDIWKTRYHNAHIGRTLPGALRRAGFAITGAQSIGIVELGTSADDYSGHQMNEVAKYVGTSASTEAAQADAWKQEQRELEKSDQYFFSLNRYLITALRPAASPP